MARKDRWARRRHRHKSNHWIYIKYFRPKHIRSSGFYGVLIQKDGSYRTQQLVKADQTPVQRHIKVKTQANPFDPRWERYFEKRVDTKMVADLKGSRSLLYLWKTQNGICPLCQDKITKETGWENHHPIHRVNGGPDTFGNRVLLHPTCHKQVHSLELSVLKPRPITGRS